jgi:hypothetical protein
MVTEETILSFQVSRRERKKMGDEVQTIQQETQINCFSKQFSYPVANVPVSADPVVASDHGIGPIDTVVQNNHLIGSCDSIVATGRINHVNDFRSSIPDPITDSNGSIVINKHVIGPIGEGPSIASNYNIDTNVVQSEYKRCTSSNVTETTIGGDHNDNIKHQTLPISTEEKTVEINTVGTRESEGGQLESEDTAVNFDNSVVKTSVVQDTTEGSAPPMNGTAPTVCKTFYPESVREVSALLQQARCSSPPQTSPPQPTPQLAAVAASSSHSCGSLYAQCGAHHHEPVSLNEIITEREHLPSYYRYHLDAIDYQSQDPLEEDEEDLLREYHKQQQRFLMGNGVSAGPCPATSSNTAATAGNVQSAGDGQTQKTSHIGASSVFRVSQPEDYDYLKGLVPQLKREAKDWEAKSDSLEAEVLGLRRELRMREQEVVRLQREVHKLKVSTTYFVCSNLTLKSATVEWQRL